MNTWGYVDNVGEPVNSKPGKQKLPLTEFVLVTPRIQTKCWHVVRLLSTNKTLIITLNRQKK